MSKLGDAFTSELHATHLKPLGFKKTRHTFSRSHEGFTERYNIQGSAWNDHDGPWTCYVNCGISFDELPPRNPDSDFPRTHAWMRAQHFTSRALPQYDITPDNLASSAALVADVILQCSDYFRRRHTYLREHYEQQPGFTCLLADPELRPAN